ncbi:MAG: glycosyltransferase [Candidatus Saganbacteria bacterium]|nr:glycosyltransferase [Candidatus Saganbacteria bacterium]
MLRNNSKEKTLGLMIEDAKTEATVSLCMIVKDEYKELEKCLESAKGMYDELVVVWNGNDPKTMDVMEENCAKVIKYRWKDDFSDARNLSLKNASCKRVLWLDADDVVSKDCGADLKEFLRYCESAALHLPVEMSGNSGQKAHSIRVIKNGYKVKFKNKVHEVLKFPKRYLVSYFPLKIIHEGYTDSVALENKEQRNEKILKRMLKDKHDNSNALFYLGMNETNIKSSTKYINKYLKLNRGTNDLKEMALTKLAANYLKNGDLKKAIKFGYKALEYNNLLAAAYIIIGNALEMEYKYHQAVTMYETAKISKPNETAMFLSDVNDYTYTPRLNLGKLYIKMGDLEKAKENLTEALKYRPGDAECTQILSNRLIFPAS